MTSANLWFQSTSIRCQGPSKTLIFPHVLMISANLANQWNPKHFHKMSEISQNTVFFHVFFVFSHSKNLVILSSYSGRPFFSHSKFGVSSFGTPHVILSSSPALYTVYTVYIQYICIHISSYITYTYITYTYIIYTYNIYIYTHTHHTNIYIYTYHIYIYLYCIWNHDYRML